MRPVGKTHSVTMSRAAFFVVGWSLAVVALFYWLQRDPGVPTGPCNDVFMGTATCLAESPNVVGWSSYVIAGALWAVGTCLGLTALRRVRRESP